MSRFHRENPDQPIQHDAFEGVRTTPITGKQYVSVSKCELCGENCQSEPCVYCRTMSREDLLEQAHETISGWKRLLIAAAIASGGQIVVSSEQLLEAEKRRIEISTDPWKDVRITIQ